MTRQKLHYFNEKLKPSMTLVDATKFPKPNIVRDILSRQPELVDAPFLMITACRVPNYAGHGGRIEVEDKLESLRCELLDVFFEYGADPNICNNRKVTALHMSCRFDLPAVAAKLLEAGANINTYDEARETPIFRATNLDYSDCVKVLLKYRADLSFANRKGMTVLHRAVIQGKKQIIPLLIEAGANIDARDKAGKRPKDYARNKLIREMLRRGHGVLRS